MHGNKGFAWTGVYWKLGELTRLDIIARSKNVRYRKGRKVPSPELARKLELAGRLIGKDLTAADWILAGQGKSDHLAFDEVRGDIRIWGADNWKD